MINPKPPQRGDIVHYTLTDKDAEKINRRRILPSVIEELLKLGHWPRGTQAHVGEVVAGRETYPAIVVAVNPIGLQVFLNGNDTYWVNCVIYKEPELGEPGTWHFVGEGCA